MTQHENFNVLLPVEKLRMEGAGSISVHGAELLGLARIRPEMFATGGPAPINVYYTTGSDDFMARWGRFGPLRYSVIGAYGPLAILTSVTLRMRPELARHKIRIGDTEMTLLELNRDFGLQHATAPLHFSRWDASTYSALRVIEAIGRIEEARQLETLRAPSLAPEQQRPLRGVQILSCTDDSPRVHAQLAATLGVYKGLTVVVGGPGVGKSLTLGFLANALGGTVGIMGESGSISASGDDAGLITALTPPVGSPVHLSDGVGKYLSKAQGGEAAEAEGGSTRLGRLYSTVSTSAELAGHTAVFSHNPNITDPVKMRAYAQSLQGHPLTVLHLLKADEKSSTITLEGWTRAYPSRPHFVATVRITPEDVAYAIRVGLVQRRGSGDVSSPSAFSDDFLRDEAATAARRAQDDRSDTAAALPPGGSPEAEATSADAGEQQAGDPSETESGRAETAASVDPRGALDAARALVRKQANTRS